MVVCRCMDLGCDHGLGLLCPLIDDIGLTLGSALASFLQRGFEILIPVLRWPTTIKADTVHLFGEASTVVVRWP
jgi:hypothetical protein